MLCRAGMMLQANTVGTMRDGMNMHLGASAGQDLGQHAFFRPECSSPRRVSSGRKSRMVHCSRLPGLGTTGAGT